MKRAYHGDWIDTLPSRFINEIPEKSIENEISISETEDFDFNQDNSLEFNEEYETIGIGTKKINCLNGKIKLKKFCKNKK